MNVRGFPRATRDTVGALTAAALLALAGCSGVAQPQSGAGVSAAGTAPVAAGTELRGTRWRLAAPGGSAAAGSVPWLAFGAASDRLEGFGGCNRVFGQYRLASDHRLAIEGLRTTRQACAPELLALEARFTGALAAAARWRRDGPRMTLLAADGATLLELVADGGTR